MIDVSVAVCGLVIFSLDNSAESRSTFSLWCNTLKHKMHVNYSNTKRGFVSGIVRLRF